MKKQNERLANDTKRTKDQLHSIIVPVYQSKDILETLTERVSQVMEKAQTYFELILVDDGSQDGSFEEIARLSSKYNFIKGVKLSRNFGHQATLLIGLQESKGAFVAIIDDDLQDPPELLPRFFETLYEDADVVYGVRKNRKENAFRRFFYMSFYRIFNILSSMKIPMDAGDFCAMKRCVVNALLRLDEANPFLRGVRFWVGFKQIGIEYERSLRLKGNSGYTFRKYVNLAITGLLMFSYVPLRIATYLGLFAAFSASLYVVIIISWWLIKPFSVPGYLSLVVIVVFLGGVQLVSIGVIGEYIARVNDNVRKWPVAIIAEKTSGERS